MASIYQLKPAFQNLLRPVCRKLAARGVTANQVTLTGAFLSLVLGFGVYYFRESSWILFCVPVFLFIRMALNAIDGMLAREFDMKSNLGAVLNEMGDVVSDSALYLPFAFIPGLNQWAVITGVILAVFTEMMGVVSVQIGASRRYDGPMGKSDRAFTFGLLSLLLGFGLAPGTWSDFYLWIVAGLLGLTVLNRGRKALKELS